MRLNLVAISRLEGWLSRRSHLRPAATEMPPRRTALAAVLLLTALLLPWHSAAQNLLPNNPNFEANAGYYSPGWGWPQGSNTSLPGWIITLDPEGDGYAGAAGNQTPGNLEGTNFGFLFSGSGTNDGMIETAPGQRAPIDADTAYTLWFSLRGDADWGEAHATISLLWHPNNNNANTVSTPEVLALTLPARGSTSDPLVPYSIRVVAPHAAHYASVRITTPAGTYEPVIFDDFVLMAEPAGLQLSIKKNGAKSVLFWLRSATKQLEENSDLRRTNDWKSVDKPVKGVGVNNSVEYPLTNGARFFRLAQPD